MSIDLTQAGMVIKKKRKELGITQQELSEKLNISQSYIAGLETGKIKNPTIENLDKIAEFLGIPIAEILAADDSLHGSGSKSSMPEAPQSGTAKNPDIRRIARAGEKLTPEQAQTLRRVAESLFPEAFKDDENS